MTFLFIVSFFGFDFIADYNLTYEDCQARLAERHILKAECVVDISQY